MPLQGSVSGKFTYWLCASCGAQNVQWLNAPQQELAAIMHRVRMCQACGATQIESDAPNVPPALSKWFDNACRALPEQSQQVQLQDLPFATLNGGAQLFNQSSDGFVLIRTIFDKYRSDNFADDGERSACADWLIYYDLSWDHDEFETEDIRQQIRNRLNMT